MQWTHLEKKSSGGSHWQSKAMNGTGPWSHAHLAPAPIPMPQMVCEPLCSYLFVYNMNGFDIRKAIAFVTLSVMSVFLSTACFCNDAEWNDLYWLCKFCFYMNTVESSHLKRKYFFLFAFINVSVCLSGTSSGCISDDNPSSACVWDGRCQVNISALKPY